MLPHFKNPYEYRKPERTPPFKPGDRVVINDNRIRKDALLHLRGKVLTVRDLYNVAGPYWLVNFDDDVDLDGDSGILNTILEKVDPSKDRKNRIDKFYEE